MSGKILSILLGRKGTSSSSNLPTKDDSGLFVYPKPQAFLGAPAIALAPSTPTDLKRVPLSALHRSHFSSHASRHYNPVQNRAHSLLVTQKDEGEKEGEEEEEEEEGESTEGVPLLLEPMGNMGMPTHLKLSAGASQQSNLAAIADTISVIMGVIKTTRSDDLPIDTLQDSQVGIHIVEFSHVLFFFFCQIYLMWCSNAVHAHTKYIVQVKKMMR
jgi:hypothetical protein